MREVLTKWMQNQGLTTSEFARRCGLSNSTVDDILKGKSNEEKIGVSKVLAISEATGISVEELYGKRAPVPEPIPERKQLPPDEQELLDLWRRATHAGKESALMVLKCNESPVKKETAI